MLDALLVGALSLTHRTSSLSSASPLSSLFSSLRNDVLYYLGSGKTTTTAFVIRTFLCRGDQPTVLVTAYTHSAVDNVLRKLQEKGVDFIRIGSKHSVHPALHGHLLEQRAAALRVDHSHHVRLFLTFIMTEFLAYTYMIYLHHLDHATSRSHNHNHDAAAEARSTRNHRRHRPHEMQA